MSRTSPPVQIHQALLAGAVAASLVLAPRAATAAQPPRDDGAAPEADTAAASPGASALAEADAALADGEFERAIELYQAAIHDGAPGEEGLAQAHFRLGSADYQRGEYRAALEHFQDAQALFPSPQFFYNIAQCYEALEDWDSAITNYKAYLRGSPDARDRTNTENKIKRLEKIVALGGERKDPVPSSGDEPEPEPEPDARPPGRPLVISGIALAVVGAGVGIGGGAGFGAVASDRSDQVDAVVTGGNPRGLTLEQTRKLDDEGRQAQTLQIVTASAGAAVGIVGVALLAVGLAKNKQAAGKTALVPNFGRDSAGFSIVGRF